MITAMIVPTRFQNYSAFSSILGGLPRPRLGTGSAAGTGGTLLAMSELMVIGGGRMGAALVAGWLRGGMKADSVVIMEKDDSRRHELARILPGVHLDAGVSDPPDRATVAASAATSTDSVVVAVKPADAEQACDLAMRSGARRMLSIMAGIPIRSLESWTGSRLAVLRAMPNTPALVGAGVSALAGGAQATEQDMEWAESLLGVVGSVVRVDEACLDAVTGLSGSGPAYIFRVVEVLAEAGVRAGLPIETSRKLARETVIGAGRLLAESDEEPETLRAQVTSPGGTTEAGLAVLEDHGIASAFNEAVAAASKRSKQLGEEH
jgi:pyrroline-5-carboxylate reductase